MAECRGATHDEDASDRTGARHHRTPGLDGREGTRRRLHGVVRPVPGAFLGWYSDGEDGVMLMKGDYVFSSNICDLI